MNKLGLVLASLVFVSTAQAGGYGDAGCGLGSIVFQGKQGFVQVFAATTNATFGSQTFGISSGTSNCGGGGKSPTTEQYIEANKVTLSNDVARGNGETVTGLAELMGCSDKAAFGMEMQKNYKNIFPTQNANAKEINASIMHVIQKNKALNKACKLS